MIEAIVESIRVQMHTHHRVLILKERNGDRHLPIWIGDNEAQAIAIELQGSESPRPLAYDLMKNLIEEVGARVERILVVDLSRDVYFARIVLTIGDRIVELDARPSDAIALAVRTQAPILVDESVMDRAGVTLDSDDEDEDETTVSPEEKPERVEGMSIDDERLAVFREFIDTLGGDDAERSSGD